MSALHVVCPACNAVNRVPSERLDDAPNCGQCKKQLFGGEPLELTSDNFDRHVDANAAQRIGNKKHVIRIVFDMNDGAILLQARFSSIQKRLPTPGWLATSMRPPIAATSRSHSTSPSPVPP